MKDFDVIKKNRKYFAATTDGYNCKILIDQNSQSLELGLHSLEVDDISVRSKYGTDLIFKLTASAEEIKNAGITTLKHFAYNAILVSECKDLGGKWDADEGAWIFSSLVEDKVEELDCYYNNEIVYVEIEFHETVYGEQGPASVGGYTIARAYDRDSGAKLAPDVALVKGSVRSGGSRVNWTTVISEGSIIRMRMPLAVVKERSGSEYYTITVLENGDSN